jgi:hypothetical protein
VKYINDFVKISGLHCNIDKTNVIPIGGEFDVKNTICYELVLSWKSSFTLLGFAVDNMLQNLGIYYTNCHEKVRKLITKWRAYSLSLNIASVLDNTPDNEYHIIQKVLDHFVQYNSFHKPNTAAQSWIKDEIFYAYLNSFIILKPSASISWLKPTQLRIGG